MMRSKVRVVRVEFRPWNSDVSFDSIFVGLDAVLQHVWYDCLVDVLYYILYSPSSYHI